MRIPETDALICLGDISIGQELKVYEKFIKPLKCKKILVKGNHDRKTNTWYLNHGWDWVCYSFGDNYFGKKILFTHYPKPADDYDLNLHGHLHNNVYKWKHLTAENKKFVCEKHLLISFECQNYAPVKLNHVLSKPDNFRLINAFNRSK
jgi:calcineurin-like phosphoesterase family protein